MKIIRTIIKISIETTIKSPKMLRFVPYHLKTKKVCKNAVKNVQFVANYSPDIRRTKGVTK